MKQYIWEPGNATRYTFTCGYLGGNKFLLALHHWNTWMIVWRGEPTHPSYIQEKLRVSKADALAISEFITATFVD